MPKISIIVPVFNVEKYIDRCIKSVIDQTYADYELILVDDGSPDNSGVKCDRWAELDERIIVIHKTNGGVSEARNVGLNLARGKYIAFVDSDDYIKNDMMERLLDMIESSDADIVMCSYYLEHSGIIQHVTLDYKFEYQDNNEVRNGLLYCYYQDEQSGLYSLCNKMIRKELIEQNDLLFDLNLNRGEDAWFMFDCFKVAQKVVFTPDPYYFYCENQGSIMHTFYKNQYEVWVSSRKRLLHENGELGFQIDNDIFYKKFLYNVAVYCRDLMKQNCKNKLKTILTDSFYLNVAGYTKYLPIHIKLLHKIAKWRFADFAMFCYKIWGLKNEKWKENYF